MKKAFENIKEMYDKGILKNYAIGGAVATIYHTEPIDTFDLDVIFIPPQKEGIILLTPFYEFLLKKGYKTYKEYIMIGETPVQFVPATTELEEEAIKNAVKMKYENIELKVLKPEYLIAIYLRTSRPKDRVKLIILMDQAKIDKKLLMRILEKHKLVEKFTEFMEKYYK